MWAGKARQCEDLRRAGGCPATVMASQTEMWEETPPPLFVTAQRKEVSEEEEVSVETAGVEVAAECADTRADRNCRIHGTCREGMSGCLVTAHFAGDRGEEGLGASDWRDAKHRNQSARTLSQLVIINQ